MKVSLLNRILSALIDFVFVIIIALAFDRFVASPIANGAWHYNQKFETYNSLVVEYEDLQDKYEIYIYTDDDKRVLNENISEEQKESFLKDSRVIEIKDEAILLQDEIRKITIYSLLIACTLSLIFCYLIFPLIFKKRATLGKKIFHLVRYNKKGVVLRTPNYLLTNFLTLIFNYIIGFGTFGLYLLANLICFICHKEHITVTDLITNTRVNYDTDYLEESLVTSEKQIETPNK